MGGLEAQEGLIPDPLVHWWVAEEEPDRENIKYSFDDVDIAGGVDGADGLVQHKAW
jgi:hypothetical protein